MSRVIKIPKEFQEVELGEFLRKMARNNARFIILNALIALPNAVTYAVQLSPEEFVNIYKLIRQHSSIESYIGHESTASFLSTIVGEPVQYNRSVFVKKEGEIAIALAARLKGRPQGEVATPESFEYYLLFYI